MKNIYFSVFAFILAYLMLPSSVFSGAPSNIEGYVYCASDDRPLSGATVRLEGSAFGAVCGRDGKFLIKNAPIGKYTLLCSIVGFESALIKISIIEKDTFKIEIPMREQPLLTGGVVVSANKRIQAVQETPISVSIVDGRAIQCRNIVRADEALSYLPGVVIRNGNVDIRGSSGFSLGAGSRVALLLDGFPLLSADNGDMKFDALPLYDIERIEVVKGAGSALYGAGALGGVVNIITREPSEEGNIRIRAYAGAYTKPRYKQWEYSNALHSIKGFEASYSKSLGDFGLILSTGLTDDESFRLYDDSFRWNLFAKLKYTGSENTKLTLNAHYADDDRADWVYWRSLDSATFPSEDVNMDDRFSSIKKSLFGELKHIFNQSHFMIFRSGIFRTEFETSIPKESDGYRQSDANSFNNELQMNSRLGEDMLLACGVNYTMNSVDSYTYGAHDQHIFSIYGQTEISAIKNLTATAGGRFDYEKTAAIERSRQFSPKMGLLYNAPLGINVRASIGKGFRAPQAVERFSSIKYSGFSVISNPDLKPERSWSYEIGANAKFELFGAPIQYDAAFFQNELFDLIEPQLLLNDVQFRNVTRARIRGVEFNLRGFFHIIGIETGLTLMDPEDLVLHEPLKYRSKVLWYTRGVLPLGFVELQADYRYMSRMERVDKTLALAGVRDVDARVPAHIFDARLIFNLKKISSYPFTITLNAKNLFDYYYTEVVGNLGATRFLSVQVQADL